MNLVLVILFILLKKGTVRKKQKAGDFFTLNFKRIENNQEILMNGTDKRFTQQNIDKILGSRETFILCNVISM